MSEPRRIGVYGGTFDPIHEVHLAVARAALAQARLDEVLFVVSAAPPHKRHAVDASAEDRFAMVEAALATEGEPRFRASRIEIDRDGPSYTADTLAALEGQFPGASLFLIIGADALKDLPGWHAPERILKLATLLVLPRPGFSPEQVAALAGRFQMIDFTPRDGSSTDIRARIAAGESLKELVPEAVINTIHERGLYRGVVSGKA